MTDLEDLFSQALSIKGNDAQFEQQLNKVITSDCIASDENYKAKELAFIELGTAYINQKQPQKVKKLIEQHSKVLENLPGAKSAKILKQLVDKVGLLENIVQIQVDLSAWVIEWCKKASRTHLRHKQEIRLANLYLLQQKYKPAIELIEELLIDVKKSDDKHLLVEAQLIESRLHFALENYSKAKASLTSCRACSNQVYIEPVLQAELDQQSGVIFSSEKDYKTGYSYFFEAFEPLHNQNNPRALHIFKYMILCKVMTGQNDDVNQLLGGKYGIKYQGPHIDTVKAIAKANQKKSLIQFQKVTEQYKEYLNDSIISSIITTLYEQLLEQNLFSIIEPYSRVQIDHISKQINLDNQIVQKKLSELILDKKIEGTLDQGNGCLILFDDAKCDGLYHNAQDLILSMNSVVDKLFQKAKLIKN